jgi:RAC serine/threonine-protein kinase
LSEFDQEENEAEELADDIEMASIAEEEELDEKFSHQGTSTGKLSGKKKVVST